MCCIMGYAGHDLPKETFTEYLLRTTSRGPDDQRVAETEFGLLGFGRLAIMGLTPEGMQPFFRGTDCVACNGELYGFRPVKAELEAEGYTFESDSDCEIILPLYYKYGLDMFKHLDAEFAMILYDSRKKLLIAARDPIGIRPLFYGYSESGHIAFASEAKNLIGLCKKIYPFPIGSYYCNGQFVRYCDIADTPAYSQDELPEILTNIREKLVAGVDKRLDADTPVGFLLSGGLDSSLVCAIAAKKLGKPIRTFAIGMSEDAIDLKYAKLRYVEKHYGEGDGRGKQVMNPTTIVHLAEGAQMEMETTQIAGIDDTMRKTSGDLAEGASLVIHEKIMTTGDQHAVTDFDVDLNGEGCSANVVSRSVAKDVSKQEFISHINGNCACAGHSECDAIIMDHASVIASPALTANSVDASLIHEAAIGKIAGEQLIKLMTLGLTEKEAEDQIVNGFLK